MFCGGGTVAVMILVTGATGTIGTYLVQVLAAAGEPVRAMTRRPEQAVVPAGVEVVHGDFSDADSLRSAAKGAEAAFLLTEGGPSVGAHDLAFTAAAADAEIRRIVKLSAFGTDLGLLDWHQPGEAAVREGAWEWTLLRPPMFASNVFWWVPDLQAGGSVPNRTGDGGMGVVHPRDVAEVAAAALTGDGHAGQVYAVTGPEALSVPEQVAILADVLQRPFTTVEATLAGLDAGSARAMEYVRSGRAAVVSDVVPSILGRPALTFRSWVEEHREQLVATLDG
jgi:uncharacterized protein YbjT (DUF2867 family)